MEENRIYPRMFTWLFIGLMITFISGYSLSLNKTLLYNVLSIGVIPIIIIELVIAFIMGFRIQKMNPITTKIFYILYSVLTGITFGAIFVEYKLMSIITIFLASALIFGILAFIGYITKIDLSKLSVILFISLISIIIISLLNVLIFKSTGLELLLCILGILVFVGYIIYDMNSVRYLMSAVGEEKAAVYGAFQLYLDFINLFIRLLELFGKRDD